MLLVCEETDRRVWFAGMNLLLFFSTERGVIDKVRLMGLDVRVFVAFFHYIDYISDGVWRNLVRMLVNLLYMPDADQSGSKMTMNASSSSNLDMNAFSSGAISIKFIIDLYLRSRSLEARSNLFVVIYDYLRECYIRRRHPHGTTSDSDSESDDEESHALRQYKRSFELLVMLDATQFFPQLFKYVPDDFADSMLAFIHASCSKESNPKLHELMSKVDTTILRDLILSDFVRLARHYMKLEPEYEAALVRGKGSLLNVFGRPSYWSIANFSFSQI